MALPYPEFKKQLMPILDRKMAEIGFGKGKSKTPTYWKYPHPDQRLVWVVCLNFSYVNNRQFDVLIGPYWMPYELKSGDPFPRCVGYKGYLGPSGHSVHQHSFQATPEVLDVVVRALAGSGVEWLSQFSSPEALYALKPTGILAADLGHWEDARRMLLETLELLFYQQQFHSARSPGGRQMAEEEMERTLSRLQEVAVHTKDAHTVEADIRQCEVRALTQELAEKRLKLAEDPRSRWYKSRIKYCEAQLKELGAV